MDGGWCGWGFHLNNIKCLDNPTEWPSFYLGEKTETVYFKWSLRGDDFPYPSGGDLSLTDGKSPVYKIAPGRCTGIIADNFPYPFRGVFYRCLSDDCANQLIWGASSFYTGYEWMYMRSKGWIVGDEMPEDYV